MESKPVTRGQRFCFKIWNNLLIVQFMLTPCHWNSNKFDNFDRKNRRYNVIEKLGTRELSVNKGQSKILHIFLFSFLFTEFWQYSDEVQCKQNHTSASVCKKDHIHYMKPHWLLTAPAMVTRLAHPFHGNSWATPSDSS